MQDILFEYEVNPTTWAYLSSLLIIGIYFKFRRFWSVRNLDLIGLIAFSPGLLLLVHGQEQLGYIWLFTVGGFFLVRLLIDPIMVRRPLLEPNLSASGLTFTGAALLFFLAGNVVTGQGVKVNENVHVKAEQSVETKEAAGKKSELKIHGAGYPPFYALANFAGENIDDDEGRTPEEIRQAMIRRAIAGTIAILGHLAVVVGMVLIGYRHFDNIHTGMAAATLYLLLPYTSLYTGRVDHVVPAALLVWAVEAYRRPVVSGLLIGTAAGIIFYPLFLLPLWCGFYWRRGLARFGIGVGAALIVMLISLAFTSADFAAFGGHLKQMVGWASFSTERVNGFWSYQEAAFRIPVIAAFFALCGSLALWPAQKDLGTLLSCSAAVMLGAQFWNPYDGGTQMGWYLPVLVLTIFRPNLEDRIALSALTEGWNPWRKAGH